MLKGKEIILRDFIESDIEKRIYWETVENEWQLWDGPWEYEGLTDEEKEENLNSYIKTMRRWVEYDKNLASDAIRYRYQIVIDNENQDYIGWCSAYCIDEDCNYTEEDKLLAVGIDIPDSKERGKGYGAQALCMFIKYLIDKGIDDIYTQTWSGNERMVHIAEKIGFEEYRRKKEFRLVRGKKYDGLTFRLNMEKFKKFLKKKI